MVAALNQQGSQIDVAGLGDAELRIAVSGLAASRPQAEIAAHVPTSLEALLVAQRQDIGQSSKLAYAIDLDQCLGLDVVGLGKLLNEAIVVLNLHRQGCDLFEHRTECLHKSRREDLHASLCKTQRRGSGQAIAAWLRESTHRVHRCRAQAD
jgi:hypothetical protein